MYATQDKKFPSEPSCTERQQADEPQQDKIAPERPVRIGERDLNGNSYAYVGTGIAAASDGCENIKPVNSVETRFLTDLLTFRGEEPSDQRLVGHGFSDNSLRACPRAGRRGPPPRGGGGGGGG